MPRKESAAFLQRHEVDRLAPFSGLDTNPASPAEVAALIAFAQREIPGIELSVEAALAVSRHNPDSFWAIRRDGQILGGISYLFLNAGGLAELLAGTLDCATPDTQFLTPAGVEPAAIYISACAARGRAALGFGTPCTRLREWPYARADYYTRPNTADGERFDAQMGFKPTEHLGGSLWMYRRLINRTEENSSARRPGSTRHAA